MSVGLAVFVTQIWDGDGHMDGGWWWMMGIGWLVFLAVIVVFGVLLARSLSNRQHRASGEDILSERFARGEIDEVEYRRRRTALRS
jgi:putative membrane protein